MFWGTKCSKYRSASVPAGGAYNAIPDSLSGLRGPTFKGERRKFASLIFFLVTPLSMYVAQLSQSAKFADSLNICVESDRIVQIMAVVVNLQVTCV